MKGNGGIRLMVNVVFFFCIEFVDFHHIHAQHDITFEQQVTGENLKTSYTNQLVMLEFWATWCGPCIAAFSHTEYLQKRFSDELIVIAMTNEPYATVSRFLEKHPLNSTILIDAAGMNHARYGVTQIPYAVLLDPQGIVLWTGHPSDLKEEALTEFIRQNKVLPASANLLFFKESKIIEQRPEPTPLNYITLQGKKGYNKIGYRELPQRLPLSIECHDGYTQFTGSVEELIAFLLGHQNSLIESTWTGPPAIGIKIPLVEKPKKKKQIYAKIREYFIDRYKINLDLKKDTMSGYVLTVIEPRKLWDKDRIQLTEEGESIYLVDDENIEADNMTLNEFSQILSSILKKRIMVKKTVEGIFDWNLHIRYVELMKEQLREEYGIDLQEIRSVEEVLYFNNT